MLPASISIYIALAALLIISKPLPACSYLNTGTDYTLPTGSTYDIAVAFSPNSLYLATVNKDSNDVTIFTIKIDGTLGKGNSYSLPGGSTAPLALAFSPNGSYLATANQDSGDVTIFSIGTGGILSSARSYPVPSGSSFTYSVAF